MKIRNSFVANSSSASFIILWETSAKNVASAVEKLFNDGNNPVPLKMLNDISISSIQVHTEDKGEVDEGCNIHLFETRYFTSMWNDMNDIPLEFIFMESILKYCKYMGDDYSTQLIEVKIETD